MDKIEKENKELLEEIEKLKRQVKILKFRKKYGLVWEEEIQLQIISHFPELSYVHTP